MSNVTSTTETGQLLHPSAVASQAPSVRNSPTPGSTEEGPADVSQEAAHSLFSMRKETASQDMSGAPPPNGTASTHPTVPSDPASVRRPEERPEHPPSKEAPSQPEGPPHQTYPTSHPGSYSTGPQYMSRPRLPQPYTYPPHVSNDMPASFEQRGMPHPDWGTPYNIPFNPGYGNHYTTPGVPPPTGTRRRKGTKPTPRRNPPRHHPAYRSQTSRNPSPQPAPDHRREDPQHP